MSKDNACDIFMIFGTIRRFEHSPSDSRAPNIISTHTDSVEVYSEESYNIHLDIQVHMSSYKCIKAASTFLNFISFILKLNQHSRNKDQQRPNKSLPNRTTTMDRAKPLDSSSIDTSAVNREIREHFDAMAKTKRDMAKRERDSSKPKRPLSAYNLFFKSERKKLVQEKRKVGFSDMAKEIAAKWKALDCDDRKQFDEEVLHEKRRYEAGLSEWKAQAQLDQKKFTSHQKQHIMSSGDDAPTFPSLVARNEPDPNLLLLLLQQRVEVNQQVKQAQLQNVSLSTGACCMSMPSLTSPDGEGFAEESYMTASLPTSLSEGMIGHHLSMAKTITNRQEIFLSSVPPLSLFEAGISDPVHSLEPIALGDSGGDDACMDPEIANAIMTIPFNDVRGPCEDESDECRGSMALGMVDSAMPPFFINLFGGESDQAYGSMISYMVEPSPMMPSF